jgi:hypothetical protein
MMRIAAAFILLITACTSEIPGYAAGVPTPAPEPAPDCALADDVDQDSGRVIDDLVVCGELAEGEADVFTVVNVNPEGVELHLETFGGPTGCLGDTDIAVRTLGGELITSDEQLGIGECAWVTIFIEGRQSVSVEVIGAEAGAYRLAIEFFTL